MTPTTRGYWSRLLDALLDRAPAAAQPGPPVPPASVVVGAREAEVKAGVAGLELDLRQRDAKIDEIRHDYQALAASKDRAVAEVGQDHLERLLRSLVGPLSNLMAMVAMVEASQDVRSADLAQLARDVEKQLVRAGLEPVGTVNEHTTFTATLHQRMSGGAVREGTPVTVRLPGYRLGGKMLLKVMVSARAAEHG